jgi:hypothetical protein
MTKNHMKQYRPTTNSTILLDMGYTNRKLCMGGVEQGKKTKNLNVVDVFTVQE